jgi:hypothetical protein
MQAYLQRKVMRAGRTSPAFPAAGRYRLVIIRGST